MPAPRSAEAVPAIACRDLVVRFGAVVAVAGITFEAHRGEVVALLGPNGAGKTSTVETMEGYRAPTGGTVRVLGLDPVAQRAAVVPRLGVMLQRGGIYPIMGAERALRLFASFYDHPEDPGSLLDLVGLRQVASTPYKQLSGGEQQRLALALALVGRPEVALLDEPTSGVDPEGRQVVRRVVRQLADDGASVVVTTHDLAEAELWADRVIVMTGGTIAAEGAPGSLASPSGDADHLRFSTGLPVDVAALAAAVGAPVHEEGANRFRVAAAGTPALVAAVTAWLAERQVPLTDLRSGASLEETYLAIVRAASGPEDGEAPAPDPPGGRGPGGRRRRAGGRRGRR